MEIELNRRTIAVVFALACLISLGSLGLAVSPRSETGRPIPLSPIVRAAEQYRQRAQAWAGEWQSLEGEFDRILEDEADLLALTSRAQRATDRALDLAREVQAGDAPSSLMALQEQAAAAAQAHVQAGLAVARWVTAPSEAHRRQADEALARAVESLAVLEASRWLSRSQ